MTKEQKADLYIKECFKYGFLTLIYLLNEYEQEEDYNECAVVVAALEQLNSRYNLEIPTAPGAEAVQYYKREVARLGCTSDLGIKIHNLPFYAYKVKQEVNKHPTS